MANLYSQYGSGTQFTAGAIVGSALGTSGLNPIVDRVNSLSNKEVWLVPPGATDVGTSSDLLFLPQESIASGTAPSASLTSAISWYVPDEFNTLSGAEMVLTNGAPGTPGSLLIWWSNPNTTDGKFNVVGSTIFNTTIGSHISFHDVSNIIESGLSAGSAVGLRFQMLNNPGDIGLNGVRIKYN